ncbi:MAG TPA: putative glycoside hydrolase, partial [Gemmatimonadales bacterium]|nr:putative glycoside hydrolase [Gemmatimonadales bacterium]
MSLSRNSQMIVVLAALVFPGRLFAQGTAPDSAHAMIPVRADQLPVFLHPGILHFAHPDQPMFVNSRNVRALYVNAWAFSSPKLWSLARLADSTEINALVVDVKDDTGCMLYPSQVPTAVEIGA